MPGKNLFLIDIPIRYVILSDEDLHVEKCKMLGYERFFIIYKRRVTHEEC